MRTHKVVPRLHLVGAWYLLLAIWLPAAGAFARGPDILLNWDRSPDGGVTGYSLAIRNPDGSYQDPVALGLRTSHHLIGLGTGIHVFRVTAYTATGPDGGYSREFAITIAPPINEAAARLAWDPSPGIGNIAGYRVHIGRSPGRYAAPVDVGLATNYSLNGLEPGTYFFAVQAYAEGGEGSPLSEEVSATIFSAESAGGSCPPGCDPDTCFGCGAGCGSADRSRRCRSAAGRRLSIQCSWRLAGGKVHPDQYGGGTGRGAVVLYGSAVPLQRRG